MSKITEINEQVVADCRKALTYVGLAAAADNNTVAETPRDPSATVVQEKGPLAAVDEAPLLEHPLHVNKKGTEIRPNDADLERELKDNPDKSPQLTREYVLQHGAEPTPKKAMAPKPPGF